MIHSTVRCACIGSQEAQDAINRFVKKVAPSEPQHGVRNNTVIEESCSICQTQRCQSRCWHFGQAVLERVVICRKNDL